MFIIDQLTDWIKTGMVDAIESQYQGIFSSVNSQVSDVATQVGQTPQGWNGSVFTMIQNLSETVVVPIAGMILTFVLVYELIQMILEKNNMHEFDTFNIFKWIFKTFVAAYLLTNCFTIVMAVFDLAQSVITQGAGLINSSLDVSASMANLRAQLMNMGVWELIGLWLESNIIYLCMWILSIIIFVIVYGRMIEIYLTVSLAPIPFSTLANREWGQIGQNYLRSLFALAFQGFLMRIKRIAALTALFLLTAAFVCSLNVFAAPVEETTAPAPTAPVATQSTQPTEPAAPTLPPGAFTPDGQGSVLDYVENEADEKRFYTITTKSGNVFYLVVDEARGEQNVYFLNAVTESDLTALTEENNKTSVSGISASQTCACTDKCKSGKVNEDCPVCKNDISKCEGKAASTADEPEGGKSEKDGGNITMYVIIGAAFIAVAGVGIYVKVIRPKKQQPAFDDDEGNDYGEYDGADDYGEPEYLPDDDDTDES